MKHASEVTGDHTIEEVTIAFPPCTTSAQAGSQVVGGAAGAVVGAPGLGAAQAVGGGVVGGAGTGSLVASLRLDHSQPSASVAIALSPTTLYLLGQLTQPNRQQAQMVTVVDPSPAARADARERGYDTNAHLHEVLDDPSIDALVLCSPHVLHYEQLMLGFEHHKHVFCEKPLCTTKTESTAVLRLAHERGLVVGGGPGPLAATGIHLVDLAVMVLGQPETVWAQLATRGTDFANGDSLSLANGFEGGATATLTALLATPFHGRFAVYGSKGWIEIHDRAHPENPAGWDVALCLRGEEPMREFFPPENAVARNLSAFASAVRGETPYPIDHVDMNRTVAVYEAVVDSVAQRQIVRVTHGD